MISHLRCYGVLVLSLPFFSSACVYAGPAFWSPKTTDKLPIDKTALARMSVETHNGSIRFEGQSDSTSEAYVVATKKAGGLTPADAREALDAIEVFVELAGPDGRNIGWRWKVTKKPHWSAQVSFEVVAPQHLHLNADTHNGRVSVVRVKGDVKVVTHNGKVNVQSSDGSLHAKSHNGGINVDYQGEKISLSTHNGNIEADLDDCTAIAGTIRTNNGSVDLQVGQSTSAVLDCRTHNGRITYDVSVDTVTVSRRRLTGTIGEGGGTLDVITHNGSVRIRKTAG